MFPFLSVRENLNMGAYTRKDADGVARDLEIRVPATFPSCATAPISGPVSSRGASSRCWRSAAR